ncbi:YfhJ family protein [Alkalicoccus saliphilus]|uniref:WVELL protein n=1 Tax=Alkalicoccus saliphilus TaxID=200989 RepID=A0A2T4U795_9BACI|nr:YfhJ family protein [Alkalicoccus saliphilus]PTL39279.1 hypothetical protein C6Y45_06605 [Alkalicoccus saliphilus]
MEGEFNVEDYISRLTDRLLEKNSSLSYAEARTWVELLWEDFEATYAKAGYEYKGKETTEKIVIQWIDNYGPELHEMIRNNPKYKKWFNQKGFYQ